MNAKLAPKPFPLALPPSLVSYNELFVREPAEAIKRLENQFRKREYDPICALMLAWFYRETGDMSAAESYSQKARLFSPGSPFLAYSPYYLDHPDLFDADVPKDAYENELSAFYVDRTLSLDELIERLSSSDAGKISLQDADNGTPSEWNDGSGGAGEDYFATETLAKIYESQGKLEEAAKVYEQLMSTKPAKTDEYREKIEALRATGE